LSPVNTGRPALVVLSAKNEERLKEKAKELLSHLQSRHYTHADLSDITYTLQVGREAMEHRLAFKAATLAELIDRLSLYLADQLEAAGREECYYGEVVSGKALLSLFTVDTELQEATEKWMERGKYARLLELWVKGLTFDWSRLYGNASAIGVPKPRRISLPTYPFANGRYWFNVSQTSRSVAHSPEAIRVRQSEFKQETMSRRQMSSAAVGTLAEIDSSIVRAIAEQSGHDPGAIIAAASFEELGMDSVMRIGIAAKVIKAFPALERHGDELLAARNWAALVRVVSMHNVPSSSDHPLIPVRSTYQVPDAIGNQAQVSAVELSALQKGWILDAKNRERDVLYRDLRILELDPLRLCASLVVDESHPFFFDHPLDHVSGVQLIEAMTQLCRLAEKNHSNFKDEQNRKVLQRLKVDFKVMCRKEPLTTLEVEGMPHNGSGSLYSAFVTQSGRLMAAGKFEFSVLGNSDVGAEPAYMPADQATDVNRFARAPKQLVNKTHSENVYVTNPERGESLGVVCCLRQDDVTPFGVTGEADSMDIVYLAEACRQSDRLFIAEVMRQQRDALIDGEPVQQQPSAGILNSIEISLFRSIGRSEVVHIRQEVLSPVKVGRYVLIDTKSALYAAGIKVGIFSMQSMMLSTENVTSRLSNERTVPEEL